MINEDSRGVGFAVLYFKKLVSYIKQQWIERPIEQCVAFDEFLTVVNTQVEQTCCNVLGIKPKGKGKSSKNKDKGQDNNWRAAGSPKGRSRPQLTSNDQRQSVELRPRQQNIPLGAPRGAKASTKGGGKAARQVCNYHDPRNGRSCRHGSDCEFRHLDTNTPSGAREFDAAKGTSKGSKNGV